MAEMLAAIAKARRSVRFEVYIFHASSAADQFLQALVNACKRGVKVRLLVDAFGSMPLPDSFWDVLRASGGEFRRFNPLHLNHLVFRDHRKILVCDESVAFVGGLNVAKEYSGDGIETGWRDLGIKIGGSLAGELATAFDDMFDAADFKHKPFTRLRKSPVVKAIPIPGGELLLSGPGRDNPIKSALRDDLKTARSALIMSGYFLPPWRLRRELARLARNGGKVQLILPSRSDIPATLLAAQSFYRRLLAAGVEIYEYQPQILHAKLFIIDEMTYVGSANFDARSLNINYEVMLRFSTPDIAAEAREIFANDLAHCRRLDLKSWRKSRTLWERIKARAAYLLLARFDPFVARWQWRRFARYPTSPEPRDNAATVRPGREI